MALYNSTKGLINKQIIPKRNLNFIYKKKKTATTTTSCILSSVCCCLMLNDKIHSRFFSVKYLLQVLIYIDTAAPIYFSCITYENEIHETAKKKLVKEPFRIH